MLVSKFSCSGSNIWIKQCLQWAVYFLYLPYSSFSLHYPASLLLNRSNYFKQATVVIIMKYQGAFHEQAWFCPLFSYLHILPVRFRLKSILLKLLGVLTHLLLYFLRKCNFTSTSLFSASPGYIFLVSGCLLFDLIFVSPPCSTCLCLQHLLFPLSHGS